MKMFRRLAHSSSKLFERSHERANRTWEKGASYYFHRNVILVSLGSMLTARVLALAWLDDMPHVMDEVTYELQAGMLARGNLTGPVYTPLAVFNQWFVEDRQRRFGIFPPGWPAVLGIGHIFDAAEWISPILHGLTVMCVGYLGYRLRGVIAGTLAAGLYGASPQAVLLAATRMSHTLVAFLAVVALTPVIAAVWQREAVAAKPLHGKVAHAVSAMALGWLFATRPLCALCIAITVLIGMIAGWPRDRWRTLLVWSVAAFPVALLLAYNDHLTGSPWLFPQTHYFDSHLTPIHGPELFRYGPGCNALGFGPTRGCELFGDEGHTLADAARSTTLNLSTWTKLSAGLGTLLIPLIISVARARRRWPRLFLLVPLMAVTIAYAAYWYPGTCYGARFYHASLPMFVLMVGVGMAELVQKRLLFAVTLLSACTAYGVAYVNVEDEVSNNYWGTDSRYIRFKEHYDGPPAVVLVSFTSEGIFSPDHSWTAVPVGAWTNGVRILAAQAANSAMLDDHLIFGRYHPALMDDLRRQMPERKFLLYIAADQRKNDVVVPLDNFELKTTQQDWKPPRQNFDSFILGEVKADR